MASFQSCFLFVICSLVLACSNGFELGRVGRNGEPLAQPVDDVAPAPSAVPVDDQVAVEAVVDPQFVAVPPAAAPAVVPAAQEPLVAPAVHDEVKATCTKAAEAEAPAADAPAAAPVVEPVVVVEKADVVVEKEASEAAADSVAAPVEPAVVVVEKTDVEKEAAADSPAAAPGDAVVVVEKTALVEGEEKADDESLASRDGTGKWILRKQTTKWHLGALHQNGDRWAKPSKDMGMGILVKCNDNFLPISVYHDLFGPRWTSPIIHWAAYFCTFCVAN